MLRFKSILGYYIIYFYTKQILVGVVFGVIFVCLYYSDWKNLHGIGMTSYQSIVDIRQLFVNILSK